MQVLAGLAFVACIGVGVLSVIGYHVGGGVPRVRAKSVGLGVGGMLSTVAIVFFLVAAEKSGHGWWVLGALGALSVGLAYVVSRKVRTGKPHAV